MGKGSHLQPGTWCFAIRTVFQLLYPSVFHLLCLNPLLFHNEVKQRVEGAEHASPNALSARFHRDLLQGYKYCKLPADLPWEVIVKEATWEAAIFCPIKYHFAHSLSQLLVSGLEAYRKGKGSDKLLFCRWLLLTLYSARYSHTAGVAQLLWETWPHTWQTCLREHYRDVTQNHYHPSCTGSLPQADGWIIPYVKSSTLVIAIGSVLFPQCAAFLLSFFC